MWSVCKQIAIFYVNPDLSTSAGYQACWQHGAYLSCWQDEQAEREKREGEKTCHRWLITLQANSWVLCLHLDSQGRPRWASLIRFFYCILATHTHALRRLYIAISHVFDLTWRTVFLITKEFAVMNPNKERDQMWLIKTLWGFWEPTQGCKSCSQSQWGHGPFLPKSFANCSIRLHEIS